jgi:hypothetical protein
MPESRIQFCIKLNQFLKHNNGLKKKNIRFRCLHGFQK